MSHCGLGLSCEPIKDSLEVCEHLVHKSLSCEFCTLQKQIIALTDMYKSLSVQVSAQHEFKLNQINANVKLDKKVNDCFERIETHRHDVRKLDSKPHKCPICDGHGVAGELALTHCRTCQGTGIVWG